MPNEREVYKLINDLPLTYTTQPEIDLYPYSLDSVKSRYIFKRLLMSRSATLLFPEVFKKLQLERDSIHNLSLSTEVKDSLLVEINSQYPRELTEIFREVDMKEMENDFLLKRVKWDKRKADKISFSKRKSKMTISVPVFNHQKNWSLFFRAVNGELEIVVFKLTNSVWLGYGRIGVAPVNLN